LGVSLANTYGKKVLLVDGNLSNANLGLQIGVVNPNVTLHHVLNNKASISEAIYEHEYGFSIIPSSLLLEETNPMKLKNHLIELRRYFDVILIDSSPTVNRELEAVMTVSDELFVITNPDYQTLLMTVRAVKMAKKKNVHITGIILNKQKGKNYEISIKDIENYTNTPVIGIIKDNLSVHEALANMKPIVLYNKNNSVSLEYGRLAAALVGEKFKEPSVFIKMLNYLKEDFDNFKSHKFKEAGFKYY